MRALAAALMVAALAAAPAGALSIVNSKHNLSADSPTAGPRASSQKGSCVFCHAVHRPAVVRDLWARPDSAQTFTFYASNYLNNYLGLKMPTMSDLKISQTRLCLSCHDGVTALGSVSSMPQPIAMDPNRPMSPSAVLGADLSRHHPVLYDVKPGAGPPSAPGTDPEIRLPPANDAVKVYDKTNRVECTSCHDPHDDRYGSFLVKSNANAALCTTCHSKTGWTSSAHARSNVAYTPPGGASATTVGESSCRACHQTHGADATQAYILRGAEEATCYNCHGTPPLVGAKDVKSTVALAYSHPIETVSGVHKDPELDASNLGPGRRHAECWDCHNPHQGQTGNHTPTSSAIGSVLIGSWGVEPVYGGTPFVAPPQTGYIRQVFANTASYKEYELCLKCHSSYAYSTTPPAGYTDTSLEFNPANASFHNVGVTGAKGTAATTPPASSSYVAPWAYNSQMACSDCHASASAADPRGPHGSTQSRILAGVWNVNTGTSGSVTGHLCFQCHQAGVYAAGGSPSGAGATAFSKNGGNSNLHVSHANRGAGCMDCHARVPHGMNRPRLIVLRSDAAVYRGAPSAVGIASWTAAPGNYSKSNCSTVGCH